MFAKTIIDSDAFLDMPMSSQSLYFHLSMRADDEGFINNPKKIQRMLGASEDDLKLLIAKGFLITFDTGVVVIKHWRIHNYLQNDRVKPTVYQDERALLRIKENKSYSLNEGCIQDGYILDTQDSIDKNSKDKDRLGKDSKDKNKAKGELVFYTGNMELNVAIHDFIEMRKKIKKPMTDHAIDLFLKKLDKISGADDELAIKIIEESILKSWTDIYPLKDDFKPKQNNNKIDWDNV